MNIAHAIAVQSYTIHFAEGSVDILQGQVLVGREQGDRFIFPLTVAGQHRECADIANGVRLEPYTPESQRA